MSKRDSLIILGFCIMVLLFLGLPFVWKEILAVIFGLSIVVISYTLPYERRNSAPAVGNVAGDTKQVPFVEHKSEAVRIPDDITSRPNPIS